MLNESTPAAQTRREANRALTIVSAAVFLASAVWFSGTAAAPALRAEWHLGDAQAAWLTTAVQLGFIAGTIIYSLLNLADRFNARRVFCVSALVGASVNLAFALLADGIGAACALRFLTGVTLAGVYPVGMKIVASWFREGLGWRLGVMVGALALGTATPYLLRALGTSFDWRATIAGASALATAGGLLLLFGVGDGPHLKARARFDWRAAFKIFRHPSFRYTAFGYFGHMWELYAFWSLSTFYFAARFGDQATEWRGVALLPLLSFATVGAGVVGCVAGGWVSRTAGERRVALVSLCVSGACSALSGFAFELRPELLLAFVLVWGVFVVSDSPQFSALAARHCPPEYTGTALTVQNGIGFAVTIFSIQLLPLLATVVGWRWAFTVLAGGPFVGAYFMWRLGRAGSTA
ncbi:MAG: MFS transporter [Pyrinomonadaceae bacterium]|nr:MFS transporter [Pyrinomonadaceae bacterium]